MQDRGRLSLHWEMDLTGEIHGTKERIRKSARDTLMLWQSAHIVKAKSNHPRSLVRNQAGSSINV